MITETKKRWKQRLAVSLTGAGCILTPITPFYTAFVVQSLWNWFLADTLHATISYWQSCGILIIVSLIRYTDNREYLEDTRWERATAMLEAALPAESLAAVNETFREKNESWAAVFALASRLVAKAIAATFALGAGWVVHTFLI
jgi:hypothetical protein